MEEMIGGLSCSDNLSRDLSSLQQRMHLTAPKGDCCAFVDFRINTIYCRPGRGSVGSELGSLGEDGKEGIGGGAGGGQGAQGAQGGAGRRADWHIGAQEPHPPPRKRGGSQGEG